MNLKEILESYRTALHAQYDANEVDAIFYIAVEFLTGFSRNQINLHLDQHITEDDVTQYNSILKRLQEREPLQYILEEAYFYGLKFKVNTSVLIPRPETEELVFLIVNDLKNHPHSSKLLDIGTGSGCIAIALKHMLPVAQVSALDISETALAVAKENAVLNKTDITFINSDIRTYLSTGKYDIIVSNPPYITETEAERMESNVMDFEPHLALFVKDQNPLEFYIAIAEFAKKSLDNNGKLYFEINANYGLQTKEMLLQKAFIKVEVLQDMQGKDRFIKAIKSN
jgi:release factor glutamine methyltransferase